MNSTTLTPILALAGLCVSGAVHGAVVVSNLGNSDDSSVIVGVFSSSDAAQPYAIQFTTGSGPGWTLNSIDLRFSEEGTALPALAARVWKANGAANGAGFFPGTVLTELTGPDPDGAAIANYNYTPTDLFSVLLPDTSYWVQTAAFAGATSDRFLWSVTTDVSQTGEPGWLIANRAAFQNPDESWTEGPLGDVLMFQVNATPVPEPALAVSVAGLALLGLAVLRRTLRVR